MTLYERLTTRLIFLRLLSVSVCLCAFTFLPLPQLASPTWMDSSETESPLEEDVKNTGEELATVSSTRRCLNNRRRSDLRQRCGAGECCHKTPLEISCVPTVVGHQFSNGLSAPFLI